MTKFKKLLLANLILAATANVAFANGGSFVPPPAGHFGGFYVGLGASRDFDHFDVNNFYLYGTCCIGAQGKEKSFDSSATGYNGKLLAGYEVTFPDRLTLAIEPFVAISSARSRYSLSPTDFFNNQVSLGVANPIIDSGTATFRVKDSFGVSILPGIWLTDRARFFTRLGWIDSQFRLQDSSSAGAGVLTGFFPISLSRYENGIEFGFGLESYLTPRFSIRPGGLGRPSTRRK